VRKETRDATPESRRGDDDGTTYRMREKMSSIADDYWMETDGGERAFKVNGTALRIRDTFVLETPVGDEVFTIEKKELGIATSWRSSARVSPVRWCVRCRGAGGVGAFGEVVAILLDPAHIDQPAVAGFAHSACG
jgi:hypothetical protein